MYIFFNIFPGLIPRVHGKYRCSFCWYQIVQMVLGVDDCVNYYDKY